MGGLLGLIIGILVLVAVVALFFITVDKTVKDPLLVKMGKIVVGVIALIYLLVAVWGALFGGVGGMPTINGSALVYFAIWLLVVIAVVFIVDRVIQYFGFMVAELQYLLGILALAAILLAAGNALSGGKVSSWITGETPSIMRGR